jgi:hypothetical protein
VIGLNEAAKTRSNPIVTFRRGSAKRLQSNVLRPRSRREFRRCECTPDFMAQACP